MLEPQLRRVQRQPGRPTLVRDDAPVGRPVIDLFTADGVPQFGQVNANLVRPSRLKAARQQGVALEVLDDVNVSDRLLAYALGLGAAAPAVAAIADEEGA